MDSSGVGRAEEGSRRDSFGRIPRDLGQDLPEAPPRTKYDNPAVAITVIASEQKHRDATFKSPGVHAARDARAATTTTMKGVDWGDYVRGGGETLGIVDAPPSKKRLDAGIPAPSAGRRGTKSGREGTQAAASKARSPFKRAVDIISPHKKKPLVVESGDDEVDGDAAA